MQTAPIAPEQLTHEMVGDRKSACLLVIGPGFTSDGMLSNQGTALIDTSLELAQRLGTHFDRLTVVYAGYGTTSRSVQVNVGQSMLAYANDHARPMANIAYQAGNHTTSLVANLANCAPIIQGCDLLIVLADSDRYAFGRIQLVTDLLFPDRQDSTTYLQVPPDRAENGDQRLNELQLTIATRVFMLGVQPGSLIAIQVRSAYMEKVLRAG